jgi:hypothetical protein
MGLIQTPLARLQSLVAMCFDWSRCFHGSKSRRSGLALPSCGTTESDRPLQRVELAAAPAAMSRVGVVGVEPHAIVGINLDAGDRPA